MRNSIYLVFIFLFLQCAKKEMFNGNDWKIKNFKGIILNVNTNQATLDSSYFELRKDQNIGVERKISFRLDPEIFPIGEYKIKLFLTKSPPDSTHQIKQNAEKQDTSFLSEYTISIDKRGKSNLNALFYLNTFEAGNYDLLFFIENKGQSYILKDRIAIHFNTFEPHSIPKRISVSTAKKPIEIEFRSILTNTQVEDYQILLKLNEIVLYQGGFVKNAGNYKISSTVKNWREYREGLYELSLQIKVKDQTLLWKYPFEIGTYQIFTVEDLLAIKEDLAGNYTLRDHIKMPDYEATKPLGTAANFLPIGSCENFSEWVNWNPGTALPEEFPKDCKGFSGTLEGNHFTISNLSIHRFRQNAVGLFGVIDGEKAGVRNLNLEVEHIEGRNFVGALAGYVRSSARFSNINVSVYSVKRSNPYIPRIIGNKNAVGGLVGYIAPKIGAHTSLLQNIETLIGVKGESWVGGIVGYSKADLNKVRAAGLVRGNAEFTGGLVGVLQDAYLSESFCLSQRIEGFRNVGGLIGGFFGDSFLQKSFFNNTTTAIGYITGQEGIGGIIGFIAPFFVEKYIAKEVYAALKNEDYLDDINYFLMPYETEKNLIDAGFSNIQKDKYIFKNPNKVKSFLKPPTETELKSLGFGNWKFREGAYPIF